MTPLQVLVLGFLLAGVIGVFAPRMLARYRLARNVQRGLGEERASSHADLSRVADYHVALGAAATAGGVDDATWSDLNLDAVFASLDRTESQIGSQYLYHMLRSPQLALEPLARAEAATQRFTEVPGVDDPNAGQPSADQQAADKSSDVARTRRTLQPLADARAAHLVALLFKDLPTRPTLWWMFPILTTTALGCLGLMVVWPRLAFVWLGVCAINIAVQLYYRPRVRPLIAAFQSVPALIRVAERLSSLNPTGISKEIATLRDAAARLAPLRRATSWLLFEPGSANELTSSIYEYLNLLFLIDVNAFAFSMQKISDARPLLRDVFEAIGRIDAAQSIARWRQSLLHWDVPVFSPPSKTLRVDGLYHPLLPQPVANSIAIDEKSILISGSNMAGKTTFMRTLGVSAILAQTLHTVCASSWNAPFLCVRTSIGRVDSLLEGKSHYLAEVESVHSLIKAKRADRQHLFLLDEMFSGTNTAERVAAAYAVLAYLTRGIDIVAVATHDLELLVLLGESYTSYHFRENIAEGRLSFDYQLRPGRSSTRNAIALLELMRYPDEIVANAKFVLNPLPP